MGVLRKICAKALDALRGRKSRKRQSPDERHSVNTADHCGCCCHKSGLDEGTDTESEVYKAGSCPTGLGRFRSADDIRAYYGNSQSARRTYDGSQAMVSE